MVDPTKLNTPRWLHEAAALQPLTALTDYTLLDAAAFCCLLLSVADSRMYAGVHFRSANVDGGKLGKLVADKVFDRIQPAKGSSSNAAVASEKGAAGRRLMA